MNTQPQHATAELDAISSEIEQLLDQHQELTAGTVRAYANAAEYALYTVRNLLHTVTETAGSIARLMERQGQATDAQVVRGIIENAVSLTLNADMGELTSIIEFDLTDIANNMEHAEEDQ
ncbi:MAG: hypothetical protein Q4D87_08850 [Actinomycetaceae bacterium]|nr:hypothetical protein [Actinomycetaceae bacterium]